MMIKFLRHGTGSAAGAARYVLADRDHLNALREGVKTLRGNAEMFSAIADSCGFKQRYTSGVIAFAPEDDPSDQELQDVLDSFEELAFAGLEKEDYHLFAVQHDEPDGSKHIHILVPRVHLATKKSLNIAPPNHSSVYYPWRDLWNEQKGWASPKDPARRRRLGKPKDGFLLDKQKQKKGLKLEKDEREFIVDSIEQGVRAGEIKNRSDVESFLRNQFLSEGVGIVSRVVKSSISVRLYQDDDEKKLGKAMRLTGAFFDHDFDADAWLAVQAEKENQGEPSQRPQKPNPDSKTAKELQARVDEIKMLRAKRQSAYFACEKVGIKVEDNLNLSNLITPRKPHVITDSSTASNAERLAERVAEQRENIKYLRESSDALYTESIRAEERSEEQRAEISRFEKRIEAARAAVTEYMTLQSHQVISSSDAAMIEPDYDYMDDILVLFIDDLYSLETPDFKYIRSHLVETVAEVVAENDFEATDEEIESFVRERSYELLLNVKEAEEAFLQNDRLQDRNFL